MIRANTCAADNIADVLGGSGHLSLPVSLSLTHSLSLTPFFLWLR